MKTQAKPAKKRPVFFLVAFSFLLLCSSVVLALLVVIPYLMGFNPLATLQNKVYMGQFSKNFESINHYPGAIIFGSYNDYGILGGSGNHCDFFASTLVASKETLPKLEDHYGNIMIPFAQPVRKFDYVSLDEGVRLDIEEVGGDQKEGYWERYAYGLTDHLQYYEESMQDYRNQGYSVYLLSADDGGYGTGGDISCH